ncbi:MAG TPA: hypothetical protein VFH77_08765, partial [Streptomyces sp.]|nr:hypothetical protein [Streptomyces sp.]
VSVNTVVDHGRGRFPAIRRSTADKLLAVQPGQHGGIGRVPAVATRRRLQALYAVGHGSYLLAAAAGLSGNGVANIAEGRVSDVTVPTRDAIAGVYRDLAGQPGPSQRARNIAARHGWAPPACWDDDTIDDPHAIPEWTGYCGTDRGWWLHRAHGIRVCPPCHQAHETWKAEHRHLPNKERVSQLRRAQSAAQTRGADLADEARRLFAYGYDLDQAAARLGVKKESLGQELRRHPARDDMEVAA